MATRSFPIREVNGKTFCIMHKNITLLMFEFGLITPFIDGLGTNGPFTPHAEGSSILPKLPIINESKAMPTCTQGKEKNQRKIMTIYKVPYWVRSVIHLAQYLFSNCGSGRCFKGRVYEQDMSGVIHLLPYLLGIFLQYNQRTEQNPV